MCLPRKNVLGRIQPMTESDQHALVCINYTFSVLILIISILCIIAMFYLYQYTKRQDKKFNKQKHENSIKDHETYIAEKIIIWIMQYGRVHEDHINHLIVIEIQQDIEYTEFLSIGGIKKIMAGSPIEFTSPHWLCGYGNYRPIYSLKDQ
jgi:hypothetical protein